MLDRRYVIIRFRAEFHIFTKGQIMLILNGVTIIEANGSQYFDTFYPSTICDVPQSYDIF